MWILRNFSNGKREKGRVEALVGRHFKLKCKGGKGGKGGRCRVALGQQC